MPDKWVRPRSLGEIFNATLNKLTRLLRVESYGWDGSNNVQVKVTNSGEVSTNIQGNNGTSWREVRIDESTRALESINYEHHEVHAGSHYTIQGFVTIAENSNVDIGITTENSTKETHLLFTFNSTDQSELYLYEGASFDADGTLGAGINNNRNSINTSGLTARVGPTVNNTGSALLLSESLGKTTTPAFTVGGMAERGKEIILATNSPYLVRITSRSAANIISYKANWYEHTPQVV